jgi:hypothetical protein
MIDATHFLDGDDEEQGLRVYTRGAGGAPLKTIDVSTMIGLSTGDEADFEDAARVGDRVYVITSHGRNKNGKLERARYRFFGMDVGGTSPGVTLTVPGYTTTLLDQMLVTGNWATPHTAVIATLTASSNLGRSTDSTLAPLAGGTNIEGLAWAPTASRPNQLLIGFRSLPRVRARSSCRCSTPRRCSRARRPVRRGGAARPWRPRHPRDGVVAAARGGVADRRAARRRRGAVPLFKWTGAPADAPVAVTDITGVPSTSAPESIVTYPNTRDVQILFDQGDHDVDGDPCKDADDSDIILRRRDRPRAVRLG